MKAFFSWSKQQNAHLISYEQLCFDTRGIISYLSKIYDVDVNADKLLSKYDNKSVIRQFNKGVRERWRDEMSRADSNMVLERYQEYYDFVK
jgi:hypothetical protein